ncbi:MAG TPA: hypothetical protein VGY97_02625 [Solirubrobacteraceae bacterium]|nr:hypothetical protein [Solirubrobacteraceae bacterium]
MTTPRRAHRAGTRLLSSLMVVIGFVLIVQAVAGETGGGLLARLILGVLFAAAGAGRLYVLARGPTGDRRDGAQDPAARRGDAARGLSRGRGDGTPGPANRRGNGR